MPSEVNCQASTWSLWEEGCTHLIMVTDCLSLREEILHGDIVITDQFKRSVLYQMTDLFHPSKRDALAETVRS